LYFKNKEYEKALEHFTKAEAHAENSSPIRKILAIVNFSTHNYEQAKDIFLQILKDDSDDIEACQYLSKIHVK